MRNQCVCRDRQTAAGKILAFEMPASEANIQVIVNCALHFLQGEGMLEQHAVAVVMRELLANAVVHGSATRSDARVRGEMTVKHGGSIEIWVEDEGRGFDYQALDLRLPADQPDSLRQRGLILVKALVQDLSWNEPGNRVTVQLHSEGERRGKHGSSR